jgi:hypothetical protein
MGRKGTRGKRLWGHGTIDHLSQLSFFVNLKDWFENEIRVNNAATPV